jgi:hypothetical protein
VHLRTSLAQLCVLLFTKLSWSSTNNWTKDVQWCTISYSICTTNVRPFIFLCAFSYLLQLVYRPSDKINIARPIVKKNPTSHFPPNLAHILASASGGICLLARSPARGAFPSRPRGLLLPRRRAGLLRICRGRAGRLCRGPLRHPGAALSPGSVGRFSND